MGRNVKKCIIILYNIPEGTVIPEFSSIAWSYDARGPTKGSVHRDLQGNLLVYNVPHNLRNDAPENIQNILAQRKYLGVPKNAQQDNAEGKEKLMKKLYQRIGLVAHKADSVQENRICHNMLVCQVANFSPICIDMTLADCAEIDRRLLKAYHYKMRCMDNDTKHHIFISQKRGGIGVKSFIQEYIGSLLRDIEVQISNPNSLSAHALCASIEAASQKGLWTLHHESRLPVLSSAAENAQNIHISGRKLITYYNDMNDVIESPVCFDHPHMMEKAINTLSQLGFMLRNTDNEFISRYLDELILFDQNAKAIGDPNISSRAILSPIINSGNRHFSKYSMTGHIGLLISVTFQEALKRVSNQTDINTTAVEHIITKESFHRELNLFPGEISAIRLSLIAKETLRKFQNDYRIASFINLFEWRQLRDKKNSFFRPQIIDDAYSIIIDESTSFRPNIAQSMKENSSRLSEHLENILRLDHDNNDPWKYNANAFTDQEIIEQALQHDLPIFVSLDVSRVENGIATVSMSIVAPDIRDTDLALEWKERLAKPLLIRSWRLPSIWGASNACINMAESIGFILGDYAIPAHIPVIYITDSDNARTLQRNLASLEKFTHRQQVRNIKQGIGASIANHLEFLTKKWPKTNQTSQYFQRLYKRGEQVCKIWANNNKSRPPRDDTNDDDDDSNSTTSDDSTLDNLSCCSIELAQIKKQGSRFTFNCNMYDLLETNIVVKVFSHQLNQDFEISMLGKEPQPNMFVASANQIVDNAADQAHRISKNDYNAEYDKIYYPPFSPQWCFSIDGVLTNKGATKVFQDKLDMELIYRQQHRPKQGLFFRLYDFIGLSAQQLGDESMLRNIVKMTAPSWTRALYRYPPLAAQAWESWYHSLTSEDKLNVPSTLPGR